MSLENGKCPCCGGALFLDSSKEKAVCRYCGNELIILEALQKVKIDGIADFDALLLGAQNALGDDDCDRAMQKYSRALDLKPHDYHALWGMFICEIAAIRWAHTRKGFVQYPGDVEKCVGDAVGRYACRAYENAPDNIKPYYRAEIEKAAAEFRPAIVEKKKGCYIATSVYGCYDCPAVWVLRRYRDQRLSTTVAGRFFIKFYYLLSPLVLRICGKNTRFNRFWRRKLDKKVMKLKANGFSDQPYKD